MMKSFFKFSGVLAVLVASLNVQAEVVIKDGWVRATLPQQSATGAFFQIQSSQSVRLIEVQSTAAASAELHEMTMDKNVMKMRALPHLDLPAGKLIELKPGAMHLMLMELKGQIKSGDEIPLSLIVETKDKKRQTITVKLKARPLNGAEMKM